MRPGDDCDDLRDFYFRAFEEALGRRGDRAELQRDWALGWIKVIAQLGYILFDSLPPDGGTSEARADVRNLATRAVERAIDACEAFA